MNIQAHFANHFGKEILIDAEGIKNTGIITGINQYFVTYISNGKQADAKIKDAKIIAPSLSDLIIQKIPRNICVLRLENGEYIQADNAGVYSDDEAIDKLADYMLITLNRMLRWNLTFDEFYNIKTRKREIVWMRQIHMTVNKRMRNITFREAAEVFKKDHATALHAGNVIDNLIDVDRHWRRDYEDVFKRIYVLFQDKERILNAFDYTKFSFYDDITFNK